MGMPRHQLLSLSAFLVACSLAVCFPPIAQAAPSRRARSCSGSIGSTFPVSPTPAVESGTIDPAVAASYAILRQAPEADDQVPPINPLGEDLSYQLRSYFPGYIRQIAADPAGARYFLIVGFERGLPIPPGRCLPRGLRRHRAQLVAEQRDRERRLVYCIEDIGPHRPRYPEANCQPFDAVQTGEDLIDTARADSEVTQLVPDGVSTVRLLYRSGAVITAAVTNNAFSFTPPKGPIRKAKKRLRRFLRTLRKRHISPRQRSQVLRELSKHVVRELGQLPPRRVEWLGGGGEPVRSFQPRRPRAADGLVIALT